MQIKFEAKKLKEANEYVSLLKPQKRKKVLGDKEGKSSSLFKRVFRFFFK